MTAVARAKVRLPLLAIVVAAVGLIAARMIWPKLHFDTTSLILFGIAAVAWSLAYVPVTKLKFGDFEAELEPLVAVLGQKVIAAEAAQLASRTEPRPGVTYRGGAGPAEETAGRPVKAALHEFQAIMESAASDREKLMRVADLIDGVAGQVQLDPASKAAVDELRYVQSLMRRGVVHATPGDVVHVLDYAGRLLRRIAG